MSNIKDKNWSPISDSEEVLHHTNPTILVYIPQIFSGVGISVSSVYIYLNYDFSYLISLAIFMIGAFIIVIEYIKYITVFYVLTSHRFISKKGIVRSRVTSVEYEDVENVITNQSVIGRVFGFGRVSIATAGTLTEEIVTKNIDDVHKLTQKMSSKIINESNSENSK
jgi:uncharacterized membrane protein YdbT with pleckstrin-like domain